MRIDIRITKKITIIFLNHNGLVEHITGIDYLFKFHTDDLT